MSEFRAENIELLDVRRLAPSKSNARTHSKKQLVQIAKSMKRYGFTAPVLVDEVDIILAGHGRVEAAKLIGLAVVPCVRVGGMSSDEKRAYILADNQIALTSGWDRGILAGEFQALIDNGFEVEATSFDWPEIDKVLSDFSEATLEPVEKEDRHATPPVSGAVVCPAGDLWTLGNHKLINGDAKDPDVLKALMAGEEADMVFTDPPYNQKVSHNRQGDRSLAVEASGPSSAGFHLRLLYHSLTNLLT